MMPNSNIQSSDPSHDRQAWNQIRPHFRCSQVSPFTSASAWRSQFSRGLLLTALLFVGIHSKCYGQAFDAFEGGEPRWLLVESDCNAQLDGHEISPLTPHDGRSCEVFDVIAGTGQRALLAYPIEPCAVLNEFQPRIWIRCSSGRIHFGVRVVFPHAEHPISKGRISSVLWGELYRETGQWQALSVQNIQRSLDEEIIALRQRFGPQLNLRDPYIDSLVLNVYTGPGRYRVQVDDLDFRGMIPLSATGTPTPANWRQQWRWRYDVPTLNEQMWARANRIPVWMEHRGESLPWLHSIGMTGVLLSRLPSETQMQRIQDANLSLIAPPPAHSLTISESVAPVVKGWLVGSAVDERQVEVVRSASQLASQLSAGLNRPLVVEALEDYWMFSRMVDEVIVPVPLHSSAGSAVEKRQWLRESLKTTTSRGHGWVSINVGEIPAIAEQIQIAKAAVDHGEDSTEPYIVPESVENVTGLIDQDSLTQSLTSSSNASLSANPLALRQQIVSAISVGAKGIVFRTAHSMDIHNPADSALAAMLRWTNNDLQLWGPWLVAGQMVQAPTPNRSDFTTTAWMLNDSYLVLAQAHSPISDIYVPATQNGPLELGFAATRLSRQVVRLTTGRLERMDVQDSPAGLSWRVQRPSPVEVFLVTSNPTVLNYARQQLQKFAPQNAADALEVAAYVNAMVADVSRDRFATAREGTGLQESRRVALTLESSQRGLDAAAMALRSQDYVTTMSRSLDVIDVSQASLIDAYSIAAATLAAPQSSPFVLVPGALGYHWRIAEACRRSQWTPLPLPGNELSSLSEMLDYGWSQQRRNEERAQIRVELVPGVGEQSGGLRLAAYASSQSKSSAELQGGYEGASIRIRSSATPVRRGQLVRIAAVARVLNASSDPMSGLLVYDNQVGPSAGQLVRGSVGERIPIEIYRFITSDGELRILAECRGVCDIVLEAISVSAIVPATNRSSYVTAPWSEPNSGPIAGEIFGVQSPTMASESFAPPNTTGDTNTSKPANSWDALQLETPAATFTPPPGEANGPVQIEPQRVESSMTEELPAPAEEFESELSL